MMFLGKEEKKTSLTKKKFIRFVRKKQADKKKPLFTKTEIS